MTEPKNAPGRGSPPSAPTWVKILVIIFLVFILLVIALHIMGFDFGHHGMSSVEIVSPLVTRQLRA